MATVEELQNQLLTLQAAYDKLEQDYKDLLPSADATAWALTEMNAAMTRARVAETALARLKQQVEDDAAKRRPRPDAPTTNAPAHETQPPMRVTTVPVAPPKPSTAASQFDSLADVLGFPKEGR